MDDDVFADRSERAKLRLTGPQRAWFLHQIVTQAFEDIEPGVARDAAMITVHGRMTAYLEAVATDDAILLHAESELRSSLFEEMRRYVFATPVDIEDVTDDFGLVLAAGPRWADAAAIVGDCIVHPTTALGVPAAYLWVARALLEDATSKLGDAGFRKADEAELEDVRIRNGVARWGRDMDAKTFPQEAGIEDRAVHYDKGCYLGQEAMAKIHFRGKVNRRLARLASDVPLEAGAEVRLGADRVGVVTSASDGAALAMLRHTVEPGAAVEAGGSPARVES